MYHQQNESTPQHVIIVNGVDMEPFWMDIHQNQVDICSDWVDIVACPHMNISLLSMFNQHFTQEKMIAQTQRGNVTTYVTHRYTNHISDQLPSLQCITYKSPSYNKYFQYENMISAQNENFSILQLISATQNNFSIQGKFQPKTISPAYKLFQRE